jgi:hypothetical protein
MNNTQNATASLESGNFVIDPKADPMLVQQLRAMVARGDAYRHECKRRGVTFLPTQVLRPVFANAGIPNGRWLKSRAEDFLLFPT